MGCKHPPRDLQSQLKDNFSMHLAKTDSAVRLDSFQVTWVDTLTERFGRVIDDTVYTREQQRIQRQLENATDIDSIKFFQYELAYMAKEIDSLTKSIGTADTIKKYGIAVKIFFRVAKNGRAADSYTYYFLDKHMTVLDSELIDSVFIKEAYAKIK
jgi:hypothetical protein